jgi:hypothetical protein
MGQPLAALPSGVATLAHFCQCPLTYIVIPKNLRRGGLEIDSAASTGRKIHTQRERKLSDRHKSAEEIPSRRGEIIAIVIAIELDFIGIIIISSSTFITTITTPSHCNILG